MICYLVGIYLKLTVSKWKQIYSIFVSKFKATIVYEYNTKRKQKKLNEFDPTSATGVNGLSWGLVYKGE